MPEYLGPHAERGTETTTYTEPMRAAAKAATLDGAADAKIVAVPEKATAVTAQATQPIVVALLRGALLALVVAAVHFFTSLQLDFSTRDSLVSAALLFFTTLEARGVIEGAFDQWKASKV